MKVWLAVCLSLLSVPAWAQPRPGAFTTIVSTDTTPTSVCVGCAVGGTSPAANSGLAAATLTLTNGAPAVTTNKLYQVGGNLFFNGSALATGSSISGTTGNLPKFSAPTTLSDSIVTEATGTITVGGNLTATGLLSVTGFGLHSVSAGGTGTNNLQVRNTTAGTTNYSAVELGNDASAAVTLLRAYSSTFATDPLNFASGSLLFAAGSGGLSVAAGNAAGALRFFAGGPAGFERMRIFPSGGVSIGNTVDPGNTNLRVTGSAIVGNGASITNGLTVTSGGAVITGATTVNGSLGATGVLSVSGNAFVGGRLQIGPLGTPTASLPAWRNTGAQMEAVLGDNSDWASVKAQNFTSNTGGNVLADLTVTGAANIVGGLTLSSVNVSGGANIPYRLQIAIVGTTYTAAAGQFVLASGTFTITLPAPTSGAVVDIKNYGTGTITVVPSSGVIDSAGSYVLSVQNQSVTVVCDSVNWWVR